MKKHKFIFSLLMAIVMMAITPTRMWAQSSVQTEPAQNEIWYTSSDGNIITPYIDSSWGVEVDKNEYKNGRGVITFKQNLTEIGEWAFSWDKGSSYNLETIVFPEGVTKIAYSALSYHSTRYNSNKLKNITIPSTVTELGMTLFVHTDIDDLYLKMPSPANITIGSEIFYDSNVGTVHVPENCAPLYRESNNWKDCNIIEMVDGPADNEIWYTTSDNKPITFEDGTYFGIWLDYFTNIYNDELDCYVLSFYEDVENQYPMKVTDLYDAFQGKTTLTSVTLPSSCKTIENEAFAGCTSLSTINLPEGLKTILCGAFSGNACTSITIPSSVTSICVDAFSSSTLTDVYVKHLTPMKGCDANAFTDCRKLTLHVPDGKIDAYAESSEIWASFGTITSPHSHNLIPFDVTITKTGASESTLSKESAKLITINKSAEGKSQVAVQSGSEEATPTVFEHATRYDFALTPVTTITTGDDDLEGNITADAKPRRTAAALQEPTLTGPALVIGTATAYTTYPLDAEHTSITVAMSAGGKYIVDDSEIDGTVTSIYFIDAHTFTSETETNTYLKTAATCTADAVYYHKCEYCDASSENNTNSTWTKTGSAAGTHTYDANGECTRCHVRQSVTYRVPTYNTNSEGAQDPTKGIASWNNNSTAQNVKAVTSSSEQVTWTAGWYYVSGTVELTAGAVCNGAVNLILCDGAKLTVTNSTDKQAGINVSGTGNSLTIYAQSEGAQMGELSAKGNKGAGIGGNFECDGSNITINGGRVTANGNMGSGIGGGHYASGTNITINGGIVSATGSRSGTGIGGGMHSIDDTGLGTNITINGGTVTAIGSAHSAGIGGAIHSDGRNITINGGYVTAIGGTVTNYLTTGIGGGWEGNAENIFIKTTLITMAGTSANPTDVITNTGTDLASSLAGKQYVIICQAGDLNNDGNVTIADITQLIQLLNQSGTITNPAADVNGDGTVNTKDVEALSEKILGIKPTVPVTDTTDGKQ